MSLELGRHVLHCGKINLWCNMDSNDQYVTKYCIRMYITKRYEHFDRAVTRVNWTFLSTYEVQNKTQNIKTEVCGTILLFLLLVVEGVESNPGPPRHLPDRGGRGGDTVARGFGARRFSAPEGRGLRNNDYFADFPPLSHPERPDSGSRSLRRSQRLQDQSSFSRQPSISSWLRGSQPQQPRDSLYLASQSSNVPRYTETDSEPEPDNVSNVDENVDVNEINMTNLLLEIRKDVKSMN